jgi:hypothetical protein
MKKAIFLLLFFCSVSYAEPTCKNTKYTLIDKSVPFGATTSQAKKIAQKFKSKGAKIHLQDPLVMVMFEGKPYKNLKTIVYFTVGDRVTRIMFNYSPKFITGLGGWALTMKMLLPQMKSKFGFAEDTKVEGEKVQVLWAQNGGASLNIIGESSDSSIMLRVDCDSLEAELRQKVSKSTNFGF